jgi:glycosyltransferase involved in cell wall biosynthesis
MRNSYHQEFSFMAFINQPTPLVTVILPVYNRRHLIERALRSLSLQTFTDWELLIVDDGSSDGLEQLVLPLVQQHPQWRYLKHSNRKLSATRNIGLQAGLGYYATFLDSDDEYRPTHLESRVQYLCDHPEVDILHGGVELAGPEKSHYVEDAFHPGEKIHLSQCVIGSTLFGKRQAFLDAGGFRIQAYAAESELLPRLQRDYTVRKVDDPTYVYHTGLPDSICYQRLQQGTAE